MELCKTIGVQKFDKCWEIGMGYPILLFTLALFTQTVTIGSDINNVGGHNPYDQIVTFTKSKFETTAANHFVLQIIFHFLKENLNEVLDFNKFMELMDILTSRNIPHGVVQSFSNNADLKAFFDLSEGSRIFEE